MKKYCETCDVELELCQGYEPYSADHLMCPICNGTYNIDEVNLCECKYAHWKKKCTWPTLEGRLAHPLTTRREALEQLEQISPSQMTDHAKNELEKLRKKDIK